MRRRKILVAGTVFLVLLIAIAWFFGGGGKGQKLKASVGFLGYTNLQDGTWRALFSITNESRVRVKVGAYSIQSSGEAAEKMHHSLVVPQVDIKVDEAVVIPVQPPTALAHWSVKFTIVNRGMRMRVALALSSKGGGWWYRFVSRTIAPAEMMKYSECASVPPPPAP